MEKCGLKTGAGRKDTLPHKLFKRVEMVEEAIKLGFYSAWNDVRKELEAYPGAEVLVVADVDEVYGENWWIALTEEAKDKYFYVRLPVGSRAARGGGRAGAVATLLRALP